jgi:uncharacterized ferritin-like protein (DUF455 family)
MSRVPADDTMTVRGVVLRRDPAREPCFNLVHLHEEVPDQSDMSPLHRRQKLHREYNQEVQTLEIAALCLSDYPEAPWALRLELARQCWDEARHSALMYRRLVEIGGRKGEFPIANLDWSVVAMLESLAARLAIQHRTFEAGSLDMEAEAGDLWREAGDDETGEIFDAIESDEIAHVRFANEWLKYMTDADPRVVLHVAAAVAWLRKVVVATGGRPILPIPTSAENRQLASFSPAEIAEVERLEQLVAEKAAMEPAR